LPSRSAFSWLIEKELRELLAARSFWILLAGIGPLVGVCFIRAVGTYAEASGLGGTAVGVGEAFSPLIGVWGPTFSACELAAAFLLPFVAIRLVAGDRMSGALKLEQQHPLPALVRLLAKAVVLLFGWSLALVAPVLAILLWRSYGGSLYPPELIALAVGHVLNAGLTVALGVATAAVAEHPSTAAILTLAVTVGTWILDFVAAVQGGVWERAAGYTPTAMVAEFQHGLVRLDAVLIAIALVASGLVFAAIWQRSGVAPGRRGLETVVLAVAATSVVLGAARLRASWDLSESRGNSFPRTDEAALRGIAVPLRVEAHLAPEDPRRSDLERQALSKLRRLLPRLEVRYVSATTIGLFEQSAPGYGEIHYELAGRRTVSRSTTAEGVLEAIYDLAGIAPPADTDEPFRGHPLPVPPTGAGWVFYGLWPAAVAAAALVTTRRQA
jgi:hypothetical protein